MTQVKSAGLWKLLIYFGTWDRTTIGGSNLLGRPNSHAYLEKALELGFTRSLSSSNLVEIRCGKRRALADERWFQNVECRGWVSEFRQQIIWFPKFFNSGHTCRAVFNSSVKIQTFPLTFYFSLVYFSSYESILMKCTVSLLKLLIYLLILIGGMELSFA